MGSLGIAVTQEGAAAGSSTRPRLQATPMETLSRLPRRRRRRGCGRRCATCACAAVRMRCMPRPRARAAAAQRYRLRGALPTRLYGSPSTLACFCLPRQGRPASTLQQTVRLSRPALVAQACNSQPIGNIALHMLCGACCCGGPQRMLPSSPTALPLPTSAGVWRGVMMACSVRSSPHGGHHRRARSCGLPARADRAAGV